MLFCQLLFQERSAKQSTGRYVFCAFFISRVKFKSHRPESLEVMGTNPSIQSYDVLCRYITCRVFSDVLGVEFPNLIFLWFLGFLGMTQRIHNHLWLFMLFICIYDIVVSWASRPAVHCPDFSANQATAGHECLLQLHPTFSKICGMPRLCSCRHVDIMDMPEKFWSASFKQHWSILSMSFQHG